MQPSADFLSSYVAGLRARGRGDDETAVAFYRRALAAAPGHAEVNANLGAALLTLGRSDEAIACYRAALDADPLMTAVRGPLGMALSATGAHEEARVQLQFALAANPDNADLNYHLGESLRALGRHAEAAARYEAAFAADAGNAEAARGAGLAWRDAKRRERAIDWLREAHRLHPDGVHIGFELGCLLLEAECFDDALPLFRQLALGSDHPSIANNLALAQEKTGDALGAIATLHASLGRNPGHANGWNTLGCLLMHLDGGKLEADCALSHDNPRYALRDLAELRARLDAHPQDDGLRRALTDYMQTFDRLRVARYAFERAIALAPDDPTGWVNLAYVHLSRRAGAAALACAKRALAVCPDEPSRLIGVAAQFEALQTLDLAVALYRRTLELEPSNRAAAARILHLTLGNCDWSDYEALVERTLQRVRDDIAAGRQLSYVVFNLLALPVDQAFVHAAASHQSAQLAADVAAQAPAVSPFIHARRERAHIRIGYLLPYTHFHSMPLVLKEIVKRRDAGRFEAFGYSVTRSDGTPFCAEFRRSFDRFADVTGVNAHAAARAIHADEIDILVDTTGHTPISCLPIMSLRPAPVQAHAIGFGLSTGADFIDYLISDRTFMPPEAQRFCSEKLVYMPDCFLPAFLRPAEEGEEERTAHGLPRQGVVFMNFNEAVKFSPRLFDVWMNILRAAPGSVLWLGVWHPPVQANLRREAEARGVSGDRLVFARIVEHAKHARRIRLADVALDNLHHGGGVTSIDALSAGVPLVTLRGATPQSRLGATLSRAAGTTELVVDSLADYEATAIGLAHDPARRARLRAELLANRASAPLFDVDRYRRALEFAFEAMHARHLAGAPPASFDVPPPR